MSDLRQIMTIIRIIDSDCRYRYNEGHARVNLMNNDGKDLIVKRGDRIVQGIFEPYGVIYADEAKAQRAGGFGSSGR